ncbi:hypothetical protein ACFQ1E_20695 [Sphingomonas canadensis]|uniref:Uncharacterized protein n=1 Tax=Sphingomonas canadensis TaxID=1219257 RepID=A0ABW3HD40_9SPHN|nr:hypothetical protein [Sphingomonas canadensis]MCW3838463.1 hypothetical protein [Sphingomonas canadensis]
MSDSDRTPLHLGPAGAPKEPQAKPGAAAQPEPQARSEPPRSAPPPLPPQVDPRAAATRASKASSFAEQITSSGRHPVILFGTGESGKSTLLISLINCLAQNDRRINISLGARIFSQSDTIAEQYYQQAIMFYERYTRDFAEGTQLPATLVEKPYFIPIDVRPPDGPEVKLAFLEGRGDWIRPLDGDSGPVFQDLKPEIIDLLTHYSSNASVIYVAPYTIGEGTRESDTGLCGAIVKYQYHRNLPERDCHLFTLAKWDTFAEPLKDDPKFASVEDVEVAEILMQRYPTSWARFKNLPIDPDSGRRYFMQYASGHIVGGIVRDPPEKHRSTFDRYPRTMWNWIYANALEAGQGASRWGKRPYLFPEVLPVEPPKPSIIDQIYAMLGRR